MTKVMIAKCGLECTQCDAYIATQKNDLGSSSEVGWISAGTIQD